MRNKKNTGKKFGDLTNLEILISNEVSSYLTDLVEESLTEQDAGTDEGLPRVNADPGLDSLGSFNTPKEKFVALMQAAMIPYLPLKFFEKHGYNPNLTQGGFGPNGQDGAGLSFIDGKLGKVTRAAFNYVLSSSRMKYDVSEGDQSHAWLDTALDTVIKILKQRREQFNSGGKEFDKYGEDRAKAKLESLAFGNKNLSVIDKRISGEEDNLFIKTKIDPLIFIVQLQDDDRNANQTIRYLRQFYSSRMLDGKRNLFRAEEYIRLYKDYERTEGFVIPKEERVTPEFIAQKEPDIRDAGISNNLGAVTA